jgi:hypothetical protein
MSNTLAADPIRTTDAGRVVAGSGCGPRTTAVVAMRIIKI